MKKFTIFMVICIFCLYHTPSANALPGNTFNIFKLQIKKPEKVKTIKNEKAETTNKSLAGKAWHFVKGAPMDNSVVVGMLSKHTSSNAHLYNETNNMLAVQYKGYTAGTFNNSFHKQTYVAGVSRKIFTKKITKNTNVNLQYKAGIMHGYADRYPDILGLTPVILPVVGLNYKLTGLDLLIIPSAHPIFCGSLRFNFPKFKNKKEVLL